MPTGIGDVEDPSGDSVGIAYDYNGVPVIVVSKILGHSKTSVTLDTYAHLILELQEDVARMMDDSVIPI